MIRQSFIVKFPSNAALEIFRERILATPEYSDLRVHVLTNALSSSVLTAQAGISR